MDSDVQGGRWGKPKTGVQREELWTGVCVTGDQRQRRNTDGGLEEWQPVGGPEPGVMTRVSCRVRARTEHRYGS